MARVLLIDDDPSIGAVLQDPLKDYQVEMDSAASGSEGLSASLEKTPSLILLSNRLPDQDGLEVLKAIRSRTRTSSVPVMVLSSRSQANRQNEFLLAGADDFIVKPFDVDIVALRVRNALQRVQRDGIHHPQTGLPTGRLIQEKVRSLADDYNWYKIDFDIENFAAFREAYGFMSSQEVISFVAGMLNEAVQHEGTPDDFIGQRADTEFVVVTQLPNGPKLRAWIEERFNEGALSFYTFMEREQNYIEVDDGAGGKAHMPLMRAKLRTQEGEPE